MSADVRNFLTHYVEGNAILLPGQTAGFKKDDIRLLSSSKTKMNVWRAIKRACEETGKEAVCYTTFTKLWEQFHPDVVIAKPMTDLCLTCQQNTSKLLRSGNLPDREKSECVLAQQHHLNCVETERVCTGTFARSQKEILRELKSSRMSYSIAINKFVLI